MPDRESTFRTGFECFKRGDFNAAIDALKEALQIAPDDPEVLRTLGMSHYRLEQYDDALALGRRLVEVAPKDALSFTTLSLFLQKTGHIKEAEEASARAKVLTWKREIKEGPLVGPGLNVVDTNPTPPVVSEPMMPMMPPPPKKKEPDSD